MLISLLNKDMSGYKEAAKMKFVSAEYNRSRWKRVIETYENLHNLLSGMNRFREILKSKNEADLRMNGFQK